MGPGFHAGDGLNVYDFTAMNPDKDPLIQAGLEGFQDLTEEVLSTLGVHPNAFVLRAELADPIQAQGQPMIACW